MRVAGTGDDGVKGSAQEEFFNGQVVLAELLLALE